MISRQAVGSPFWDRQILPTKILSIIATVPTITKIHQPIMQATPTIRITELPTVVASMTAALLADITNS